MSGREVREWIASGRATASTHARSADEQTWRPLGQFIEFEGTFPSATHTEPPPLKKRSPAFRLLSIMGFVLSLAGVFIITALAGIVLGIVSLLLIRKRPQDFGGPKLATAAIVIGVGWLIAWPTFVYYQFNKARDQYARGENCFSHAQSLTRSLKIISIANGGAYPDADSWCDAIRREVTSTNHYRCPDDPNRAECAFAYNERISGVRDPNPNTVVLFESDLGWNGSGGVSNVITKPRHNNRILVGFASGAVRPVSTQDVRTLRWEP